MSDHRSAEKDRKVEHGYGDTSDCLCGRNFATVRGLREHLTKARMAEHHPNCYQRTGVPDDLPPGLCDCRVLRMIDEHDEHVTPAGQPPTRDLTTRTHEETR